MTRKLSVAVILGVLVASGAYALIYLFRWEWHRAIITGIFFLAAELALVVLLLLRRLTRLEHRLEELASDRATASLDPAVLERIRASGPPPRRPFAWLDPRHQHGTNVFLPFLLGIGAVASGLAWVVDQVARHTATPVLEQRLAQALAPLSLPAGGLLGTSPAPTPTITRARRRWPLVAAIAVVTAVLAAGSIDWLADALQTRPDAHRDDVTTTIELELRGTVNTGRAASVLWGTCNHVLYSRGVGGVIEELGAGRVAIKVPADIGRHGEQRLRGCLQDSVVDWVQATVVSVEPVRAG